MPAKAFESFTPRRTTTYLTLEDEDDDDEECAKPVAKPVPVSSESKQRDSSARLSQPRHVSPRSLLSTPQSSAPPSSRTAPLSSRGKPSARGSRPRPPAVVPPLTLPAPRHPPQPSCSARPQEDVLSAGVRSTGCGSALTDFSARSSAQHDGGGAVWDEEASYRYYGDRHEGEGRLERHDEDEYVGHGCYEVMADYEETDCESDYQRVVSISVSQWTQSPPTAADWVKLHGLLSGDAKKKQRPRLASSPTERSAPGEVGRGSGVSSRSFFSSPRRPRNAKERPSPYELWKSAGARRDAQSEPVKRRSPPREAASPPLVRPRRPFVSTPKSSPASASAGRPPNPQCQALAAKASSLAKPSSSAAAKTLHTPKPVPAYAGGASPRRFGRPPSEPEPTRPSSIKRASEMFRELSHVRDDGERVLRLASVPLALEAATGADLESWEGKRAIELAYEFGKGA